MTERLIQMTKRLLLSLTLVSTAHAQWEQLPPLPEPNGGFIGGHHHGKIVIVGGTNWEGGHKNWLKKIQEFDPVTNAWTATKDLEAPVAYAVSMQNGSQFSFVGGTDGKQPLRVHSTLAGDKTVLPILPASTVLAAGGNTGGWMILVGGTDDAANLAGLTRMTHAIMSGDVKRLADHPGKPLATAASSVVGGQLFVFGGMNYDAKAKLPVNTAEAYAFSLEKNAWRKLMPLPAPTRGLSAVTLDETHIYIAGGYRDDFTADAVIYDVKADSYRKATPLPYAAMVGLVRLDGFVYCLGGEDKMKSRTDKFFRIPVAELLK